MSSVIIKRINREIAALKEENLLINEEVTSNNHRRVDIKVFGPPDSPFEGGEYLVSIIIDPKDYPFQAPEFKFLSKIFHPNIFCEDICLDVLQEKWSAALSLLSVAKSLESLLAEPNPDSPLDGDAAESFMESYEFFCERNKQLIKENLENGNSKTDGS